jgi:hypothetical protein
MIFPSLELESVVQVNDKTRLDGTKTFLTPDEAAITLVRIEPEAAAGFIDVTNLEYLDYSYSTDGTKTVTIEVTTDGAPETFTKDLTVVTAIDDKLFSGDAELVTHEPNILSYVRDGRNSFLDIHRTAQDRILTWLDEHRIWDINGDRLTKDAIVDIEEVNDWSKFMTLAIIFEGISNAVDDIFMQKSAKYKQMAAVAMNRASMRLDRDGDGSIDDEKPTDVRTSRLRRR